MCDRKLREPDIIHYNWTTEIVLKESQFNKVYPSLLAPLQKKPKFTLNDIIKTSA
jgi:hypothetical protein